MIEPRSSVAVDRRRRRGLASPSARWRSREYRVGLARRAGARRRDARRLRGPGARPHRRDAAASPRWRPQVMGQGTPAERARRLESHLIDNYTYTLDFVGRSRGQPDRGLPLPLPQRPVRVLRLLDGADAALAGDPGAAGDRLPRRRVQPLRGVLHRAREQRPRLGGGLSAGPGLADLRSHAPRRPAGRRQAKGPCSWPSRPGTSCCSAGTATSSPSASTTSSASSAACASCGATSGPTSSAMSKPAAPRPLLVRSRPARPPRSEPRRPPGPPRRPATSGARAHAVTAAAVGPLPAAAAAAHRDRRLPPPPASPRPHGRPRSPIRCRRSPCAARPRPAIRRRPPTGRVIDFYLRESFGGQPLEDEEIEVLKAALEEAEKKMRKAG